MIGIEIGLWVFAILGIVSFFGAHYTAKYKSAEALIGLYVLFLTAAQILATKIAIFDFGFDLLWVAPVGVIVFPFTLQLTDMVNERFGRKEVYKMIAIGFITQVVLIFFLYIGNLPDVVPGKPDAIVIIAEFVPRIVLASLVAFLVSETFDAWIYDKLRVFVSSKTDKWWKYLWVRNVFSDILSLGIDSLIFVPIAFLGVLPDDLVIDMIIGQLIIKWFLGVIDTPFMYLTRWIYEKYEKIEITT